MRSARVLFQGAKAERTMRGYGLCVGIGIIVLSGAISADAARYLRCGNDLVSVGDRRIALRAACGEPDLMLSVEEELVGIDRLPYEEAWFYNRGADRFIREVRIRNGRIVSIHSRGYGFNRERPGPCEPGELTPGMTPLELVARCGDPDDREVHLRRYYYDPRRPSLGARIVIEEEWVYNFGPRRYYRVFTVSDGAIQRVDTEGRGH